MPNVDEEPASAADWIMVKVTAALGQAKLWPVRLASVRNQLQLRF